MPRVSKQKQEILDYNKDGWPRIYETVRSLDDLRALRARLHAVGEDFNASDFFDKKLAYLDRFGFSHDLEYPVILRQESSFTRAALDLMHEIGESVSIRKFRKEYPCKHVYARYGLREPPPIYRSLLEEWTGRPDAQEYINEVFRSTYWDDHPADLIKVWHALPEDYRKKYPKPLCIEYADRPTIEHLRRPRGWYRRLTDNGYTPEHVEGLGLYKLVKDGHVDYLFSRMERAGEKLTLDDVLLGRHANIPTVLDMLVEQGHLALLMEPERWVGGQERMGPLVVGLSVDPALLKAAGYDREALREEFRQSKLAPAIEGQLKAMEQLARPAIAPMAAEEVSMDGETAHHDHDHGGLTSLTIEEVAKPVKSEESVDFFSKLLPPDPISMDSAHKLVTEMQKRMDEQGELLAHRERRIAELERKLGEKPATVIVPRDLETGEKAAMLSDMLGLSDKAKH